MVGREALAEGAEALRVDVLDVALAAAQGADASRVRVIAHDVVARLRERDREGQADVAKAYDADPHRRQSRRRQRAP